MNAREILQELVAAIAALEGGAAQIEYGPAMRLANASKAARAYLAQPAPAPAAEPTWELCARVLDKLADTGPAEGSYWFVQAAAAIRDEQPESAAPAPAEAQPEPESITEEN